VTKPIAERTREDPHDQGGRLGDAFDHADRKRGRAETHDQIERQQRMNHLGGDVHQHRDDTERPDAARNLAPAQK